jgi:hypothetical protein
MSEEEKASGTLSTVEGQASTDPSQQDCCADKDAALKNGQIPPPQLFAMMAQITQKLGPDPETTKVLAENERHAEDNRLEAYKANLGKQEQQSQRDHEYRLAQMKHAQTERYFILVAVLLAFVTGIVLSLYGNPLGNAIMIAMLPVLGILISGKVKIG